MMFSFFTSSKQEDSPPSPPPPPPVTLFVIVSKPRDEILEALHGLTLRNGRPVHLIHSQWQDFTVSSDASSGTLRVYVDINKGPCKGVHKPDFLLIRAEVRALGSHDFRNSLFAFMYGNIPSINSLHSVYCFLERPVVQAELNRLRVLHGSERFPVVRQSFFGDHRHMIYGDRFPAVVKAGHAHAGYGKMKVEDHHMMEDVRSLLSLNSDYVTVEPFIEGSYDLRIQKIGSHFRAFKRTSLGGSWKTNVGSSVIDEIPVSEKYLFWITEASRMFGGLDICTVDAIYDTDKNVEYIMEVNGCSSGFSPQTLSEDNLLVRDLVLNRMNELPHLTMHL
jgi:hypothetical protein